MRLSHKAGCDYGVDYGAVVVFFLWVVATIVLLVVLAVRGNSQDVPPVQASVSCSRRLSESPLAPRSRAVDIRGLVLWALRLPL